MVHTTLDLIDWGFRKINVWKLDEFDTPCTYAYVRDRVRRYERSSRSRSRDVSRKVESPGAKNWYPQLRSSIALIVQSEGVYF